MTMLTAGPNWHHHSGQAWVTTWTPEKVAEAPDPLIGLANYIEQILGVGFPTKKDLIILRARVNEVFQHYPHATYATMCRLVRYNKKRRRKFARVYCVIDTFREAMADGVLPELAYQTDETLKQQIARVLETETDTGWRRKFAMCVTDDQRQAVLVEWRTTHAP